MCRKAKVPVLVTGFGPFSSHNVNISWEVAKTLKTLSLEQYGIQLLLHEIPVAYSTVTEEVPLLWKKYLPKLVIHMGVTGSGKKITLETIGHRDGYEKPDIHGKIPPNGSAKGDKEVIATGLKAQEVADQINNSVEFDVPVIVSSNAGRYLCEFIFYTSLNIEHTKTIFIHIPDFDKGFTVMQMALVIKQIILLLLEKKHNSN